MENNAIMQRVMMLSEMWAEEVNKNPRTSVFAWVGASSVEFKTIKGFVIYQTSLEKTLQDKIMCLNQAFEPELRLYGGGIVSDLQKYFTAWNKKENLIADTGKIEWDPLPITDQGEEAVLFLENMRLLADSLQVNGKDEKLVLALFPSSLTDIKAFSNWIELLITAEIPNQIRIMLYESRDSMYFKDIAKNKPDQFKYLYPDLDIAAAMNEILEETKAKKNNQEEKDKVSFKQALIKMNEAIGYNEEEDVFHYRDICLKLSQKYGWQEQQALVHFFLYTYFAARQKVTQAHQSIDTAIAITSAAIAVDTTQNNQTQYQYYIAKGNLHFMSKAYQEAAGVYRKCLSLDRSGADLLMLAGIHQMLGNSLREFAEKKETRQCFEEGWQLLYSAGEQELKDQAMAMFYARDMLSIADQEMTNRYAPIMKRIWGIHWENELMDQYKQLSKTK